MQNAKPVERQLVKLAEKVLEMPFSIEPTYGCVDAKGIEAEQEARLKYFGVPRDLRADVAEAYPTITHELVNEQRIIFLNIGYVQTEARRLNMGLTSLTELLKLHALGHVFSLPYTSRKLKDACTVLLSASDTKTKENVRDFVYAANACDESFSNYIMLESARLISEERLHQAQVWHEFMSKKEKKYSYVQFFYALKNSGLKIYLPYVNFPKHLPNMSDLKSPSRYIRDISGGKTKEWILESAQAKSL